MCELDVGGGFFLSGECGLRREFILIRCKTREVGLKSLLFYKANQITRY